MAKIEKPKLDKELSINTSAVEAFISGGTTTVETIQIEPEEEKPVGIAKGKKEKDTIVELEVALSYKVPVGIHEKIQEYVFMNRKEGATIKKYVIDALVEKMKKDKLI